VASIICGLIETLISFNPISLRRMRIKDDERNVPATLTNTNFPARTLAERYCQE
jgi:hypothetical protein